MDAAGSPQATIFGVSEGASMACLFAATYPQHTRSLIVWGGQALFMDGKLVVDCCGLELNGAGS
jgi:pimeloyl-ACP methyl ester carboxylesterase